MAKIRDISPLKTKDGRKIYTLGYINALRKRESEKKHSKVFIAQEGPQEDGLHQSVDILVYGGNRGGGKATTYDTTVCTPTGKRRMGDLEVGDLICTPYDGVQRVEEIFEQGRKTVYRIHFNDGTWIDCMDNHTFYARQTTEVKFEPITAGEIFNNYNMGQMNPNSLKAGCSPYEIPLCGEVKMSVNSDLDLPVHPFVFGAIISANDGKTDYESYGYWLSSNDNIGHHVSGIGYDCKKITGSYIVKGIKRSDWAKMYPVNKRQVEAIGKLGKKKVGIPQCFKSASPMARWELLRGLFCYNSGQKKKHPYLELPNKEVIEDVADVARSLGCFAMVKMVEDDPEKFGYYRVSLICPNDKDIWFLNALKSRAKENGVKPKEPTNNGVLTKKIMWVEKKEKREKCRCITVTGKDHLYLTDAYTINHNTWVMLAEPYYDIFNSNFRGIIFRKNKDDFDNIINETKVMYKRFGHYNKSSDDMTWYFNSGSELNFSIYEMAYQKFDDKYRGQQFAYIGIDELPQMSFQKFKFLMTCNRNVYGIKSRIIGTCNPDPYSWLRVFIDWYLDKDGYVIPERSGKIRYFYSPSNNVEEVVWGDTPEEVYEQCKDEIDQDWDPEYDKLGYDKTSVVKSFSFIKADLKYNKILLKNDTSYFGSLKNQSAAMRARELSGCWNPVEMGEDLIKISQMERCFHNDEMTGDGIRRASCDVAFEGGDSCVLFLWIGWHVADVFVCKLDSVATCTAIDAKLREWGVLQQNFTYDLNGLGQTFKGYFKHAIPFNNVEAVQPKFKNIYDNIKSQCAYMFAERMQNGDMSFNSSVLDRRYSGKGFENRKVHDILLNERRAIKQDESKMDKGWCLIKKSDMKKIVGHSPDFLEALIMRMIFEIKHMGSGNRSWVANM